jgi:hypothetical protein
MQLHGIHRVREEEVDQNHMAMKWGVRDEGNELIIGSVGMTRPIEMPGGFMYVAYAPVTERKGIN